MKIFGIGQNRIITQTISRLLACSEIRKNEGYEGVTDIYKFNFFDHDFTLISLNDKFLKLRSNFVFKSQLDMFKQDVEMVPCCKQIIKIIKENILNSDILLLFFSNTREYESIADDIEMYCKRIKDNVEIQKPMFNFLGKDSLIEEIKATRKINIFRSISGKLEYLMNFRVKNIMSSILTPILNNYSQEKRNKYLLTISQLSILAQIVKFNYEKTTFKPEIYYEIECKINKTEKKCKFCWERKRLFCKLSSIAIYSSILIDNNKSNINIDENLYKEEKPLPLNCTKLICLGMKYLKLDDNKIIELAQSLYEEGYITYPFNNCDSFPDDFNFLPIILMLASYTPLTKHAAILRRSYIPPRKGKYQSTIHLPIYPIKVLNDIPKTDDKMKLYDLIARHFLAECSNDAIMKTVTYSFIYNEEKFSTSITNVEDPQFLNVYSFKKYPKKDLYNFTNNSEIQIFTYKLNEKKTLPPPPLSKIQLIKFISKKNINRNTKNTVKDIEKLLKYGLIDIKSEVIESTKLGFALIASFEEIGFNFTSSYLCNQFNNILNNLSFHNGDQKNLQNQIYQQFGSFLYTTMKNQNKFKEVFQTIFK